MKQYHKFIDGIMHHSLNTDGPWKPYTLEELSNKVQKFQTENQDLRAELILLKREDLKNESDLNALESQSPEC